jgi:hypothetical protein
MKQLRAILILLCLFAFTASQVHSQAFSSERAQADKLIETIPISELMGPLAPVALSPFFGLTCLSGMSLLSEHSALPVSRFISDSKLLNSEIAFGVLLLLTLVTSIPKFSKVSKPFAQFVDQIEAYAGIVAFGAIMLANNLAQSAPDEVTVVYTAGFLSLSGESVLILVAAINIFVINTVKFLFEVLTFVSPIPAIDAVFELINKAVVALLMFIYSLSPAAAFGINVILFLFSLCLFRWARRWVKYFREIVLLPGVKLVLGRLKNDTFSLERKKVPPKLRKHLNDGGYVIRAFPLQKGPNWKKRQLSYLFVDQDSCILARHQLLNEPIVITYNTNEFTAELESGLLSNRVTLINHESGERMPVVFSRTYDGLLEKIAAVFGIENPENKFENLFAARSIRQFLRKTNRDGLQAEMK